MSFDPKSIREKVEAVRKILPVVVGAAASLSVIAYSLGWIGPKSRLRNPSKKTSKPITQLDLPYRDAGCGSLDIEELSNKKSVEDIDVSDKRILIRTDFNVLIGRGGCIEDTSRIDRSLPTIRYLLKKNVKCIVIITHIGRPTGEFDSKHYSTEPLIPYLRSQLPPGTPVEFLPDCIGRGNRQATLDCVPGTVFLAENLRFHVEEIGSGFNTKNQKIIAPPRDMYLFSKRLSSMGDVFVFEAYGAAHRPHSSIVHIRIPVRVAGLNMAAELRAYRIALGRVAFSALNRINPDVLTLASTQTKDSGFKIPALSLHTSAASASTTSSTTEPFQTPLDGGSSGHNSIRAIPEDFSLVGTATDSSRVQDEKSIDGEIEKQTQTSTSTSTSSNTKSNTKPKTKPNTNTHVDNDVNVDIDGTTPRYTISPTEVSIASSSFDDTIEHTPLAASASTSTSTSTSSDNTFQSQFQNQNQHHQHTNSIPRSTSISISSTGSTSHHLSNPNSIVNDTIFLNSLRTPLLRLEADRVLSSGSRFVVVVGSAMRVKDKLSVLSNLVKIADDIIITGGMAFTFKSVLQTELRVGASMVDVDAVAGVQAIIAAAEARGVRLYFPFDHRMAESLDSESSIGIATDDSGCPDGWVPLDVGPASSSLFSNIISKAHTTIWIGTVGCFEWGPFSAGTLAILQDLVEAQKRGAYALIAGGDAATAARNFFVGPLPASQGVSFVSSGGGSSLVMLEGTLLHGAVALNSFADSDTSSEDDDDDDDDDDDESEDDDEDDDDENRDNNVEADDDADEDDDDSVLQNRVAQTISTRKDKVQFGKMVPQSTETRDDKPTKITSHPSSTSTSASTSTSTSRT